MRKIAGAGIFAAVFFLGACMQPSETQKEVHPSQRTEKFPKVDHVVVVVEENHSSKKIEGNPSAPYLNTLMKQGANLTNYHAIEHPSQPNYLDLFSGSNQGVTNDRLPATKFNGDNLASELIKNKKSFTGYSEDMPVEGFNGISTGKGGYARKHNPWVNFTNVPKSANQPFEKFPKKDFSKLPTIAFVIPNLENDMHDGSIAKADQWLRENIDPYVTWAKRHNSLLIVTWDEDDYSQNNKISTFLVGPMIKTGEWNEELNHFNLLRTIEDIYELKYTGKSAAAEPITGVWK